MGLTSASDSSVPPPHLSRSDCWIIYRAQGGRGAALTCFNIMHKDLGDGEAGVMCLINSSVHWAVDRHSRLTGDGETSPACLSML